mgnify:CR=1 FL=1
MRTLHCSDAGFDCEGVVVGQSDEEVLQGASKHAREVHGVDPTPEMVEELRYMIREE